MKKIITAKLVIIKLKIIIKITTTILLYKAKRVYLSERLKIVILRKTKKCISLCF